ncbi:hypothetical protein D621_21520 [beta proteobacterium AAP51]|nr:hypothetical protein D621_21520 [beta proteobacterium AAP51]
MWQTVYSRRHQIAGITRRPLMQAGQAEIPGFNRRIADTGRVWPQNLAVCLSMSEMSHRLRTSASITAQAQCSVPPRGSS